MSVPVLSERRAKRGAVEGRVLAWLLALTAAILATLGLAPLAAAEDEVLARARAAYEFEAWPGRDGPSRDGLDLEKLGAPPGVPRKSLTLRAAPGGPVLTAIFGGGTILRVWVEETPAEAQERLLETIAGATRALDRLSGERARGDVAFGVRGADQDAFLAFASANVCAVVRGPLAAVDALGGHAAALVAESPVLEGKRARTIAKVAKVAAARSTAPREVALSVEIAGPTLAREVQAGLGAALREDAEGALYLRGRTPGAFPVTVHALSPRGWRTSRTETIEVGE